MRKKTYKKQFIYAVLCLLLVFGGVALNLVGPPKVQAQQQPNLALKIKVYNYCAKAMFGYTGNPVTSEPQIDQSGVMSSYCAKGYLSGFFENLSKQDACHPNALTTPGGPVFPGLNPTDPTQTNPNTPTTGEQRIICNKAYDQGKNEQGKAIQEASGNSENVCNKTANDKKEQCKQALKDCKKKPNKDKLACMQKLAQDYPQSTTGDAAGDDEVHGCDGEGLSLGWILCPIIETVSGFGQYIFKDFIQPMMEKRPIEPTPDNKFYQSWQGFRFLGNILLIGSFLAIVYSQTRGGGN